MSTESAPKIESEPEEKGPEAEEKTIPGEVVPLREGFSVYTEPKPSVEQLMKRQAEINQLWGKRDLTPEEVTERDWINEEIQNRGYERSGGPLNKEEEARLQYLRQAQYNDKFPDGTPWKQEEIPEIIEELLMLQRREKEHRS